MHAVWPTEQQSPELHALPAPHVFPHEPQLSLSVFAFTQPELAQ